MEDIKKEEETIEEKTDSVEKDTEGVTEMKIDGSLMGPAKEYLVVDTSGRAVRMYSTEIHGEGAEDLAKQFALKINGSVQ